VLVAVRLPPPEAADAVRAAWDAGRPVAPLDPFAPEPEIARALAAVRPDKPVHPDVAAVVTTSGTAGAPRAVELTWAGLEASATAVSSALDVHPGDRWLCCLPLHHVAGLAVLARSWATGVPVTVVAPFDPDDTAAAADATLVSLVPTQMARLLDAGADLSRFRRILVGGAPVPDRLRAPSNVVTTYGLTETWGGVVHDGIPLPGADIRLATSDNEVQVRGPMVMRGYRLDPEATAAAFTADGWLRTGDAGAWEREGRLRVVDRLRDLIITGGVNVSPTEVEAVLARHPAVADVCVAGRADPDWGERVVAYVVAADASHPPRLDDLRAFARDHLAPAKLPRQLVVLDRIPRTPGGKALRRQLSKIAQDR
jgi:O-succinylbenzoic acid--CoA ligase